MTTPTRSLTLLPDSTQRLANLCGRLNEHIQQIEKSLELKIQHRGNIFQLSGTESSVIQGCKLLKSLYSETSHGITLSPNMVHLALQETKNTAESDTNDENFLLVKTPRCSIKPRSPHQTQYVRSIRKYDISFGIGPAGTGKTYLAVACAVEALSQERVNRVLLVRPAVEAGEKLGFLPGDIAEKINPYFMPLYDALDDMMEAGRVRELMREGFIEIAPLAYMRGRTLNDSFVILDEAQNSTREQMKMFLTRLGFRSKMIVTGDVTQIDLANREDSGLAHVQTLFKEVNGIHFINFSEKDVVRHDLVKQIIRAYNENGSGR